MNIISFTVLPDTPKELKRLNDLARNMWFSWNPHACKLFEQLDPESWEASQQSPMGMLCLVPAAKLAAAAKNQSYVAELEAVYDRFNNYMSSTTWFERHYGKRESPVVAYFSCEFGLHESLPVYSGGLGVLAGDHIKSAGDLGIPLVAVGLFYRQGYFRQYLNADGWQQERYPDNDWHNMPLSLVRDDSGAIVKSTVDLAGETVAFQIWQVDVGRIKIYLLDTNLEENSEAQRDITVRLYEGDRDKRIRQEVLLGIGGVRALEALGYDPSVYHVNEGHSAFLMLERMRSLMTNKKLSIEQAREVIWASTLFTTHTPVPAGNERFNPDLVHRYLSHYTDAVGFEWQEFLALGRENPANKDEDFCMTVLALKLCGFANGVSRLHGAVSRDMWQSLYPGVPTDEIPIGSITNGVHIRSWMNPQLRNLFLRYLGPTNVNELADFSMFAKVDDIPDDQLWSVHQFKRERMVQFVHKHVCRQLERRGARASDIDRANEILDPNVLTIGLARRFATYKRSALFLSNPERLKKLMTDKDRPIQLVIAGKAHPADDAGKEIIRQIVAAAESKDFYGRIVFLEDYDIRVARNLVQGVDVWLNNPRRPQEASGTSGMKAALNGALNLSILDGWWDEAYTPQVGFAIGRRESYDDTGHQDAIESELLYSVLEKEVVPRFYDRDEHGIPRRWVRMMKNTIGRLASEFNSHRMLVEYTNNYYLPCEGLHQSLAQDDYGNATALAKWRDGIAERWSELEIVKVQAPAEEAVFKGEELEVSAWVKLGSLSEQDVVCEVYHGPLANDGQLETPSQVAMTATGSEGDATVFTTKIRCNRGGRYGYTVRLLPGHEDLAENVLPNLMKWA